MSGRELFWAGFTVIGAGMYVRSDAPLWISALLVIAGGVTQWMDARDDRKRKNDR